MGADVTGSRPTSNVRVNIAKTHEATVTVLNPDTAHKIVNRAGLMVRLESGQVVELMLTDVELNPGNRGALSFEAIIANGNNFAHVNGVFEGDAGGEMTVLVRK